MKYLFICCIAFLISCKTPIEMTSIEVDKATERVENLVKEINSFSEIQDTEYDLFNVNGFSKSRTLVAGGSSFRYDFVIKVDTSELHKWTDDMIITAADEYSIKRFEELVSIRKENWNVNSKPTYYKRGDMVNMMVYKEEGIVFKSIYVE